jgi:hypothetical protein
MGESKMTSVLITTSQFLATLTYPVKNKVEQHVSRNVSFIQESIDAVVEVVPIVHKASKGQEIAVKFYNVLSQNASNEYMRSKRENMQDLLESCGQKVREEMKESIQHIALENLLGNVETVIINLLDKSGTLVQSKRIHIEDILWTLGKMKEKLLHWRGQKKVSAISIQHETAAAPKPRRKEKINSEKESGGTRRFLDYNRMTHGAAK